MKPAETEPRIPIEQLPIHGTCQRLWRSDGTVCGGRVVRPDGAWGLHCQLCGWYEEIMELRGRQSEPRRILHQMEQEGKPRDEQTVYTLDWCCMLCGMPGNIVEDQPVEGVRKIRCTICPAEFQEGPDGKVSLLRRG